MEAASVSCAAVLVLLTDVLPTGMLPLMVVAVHGLIIP